MSYTSLQVENNAHLTFDLLALLEALHVTLEHRVALLEYIELFLVRREKLLRVSRLNNERRAQRIE